MLVNLGDEQVRFPSGRAQLPRGRIASLDRIAALLADYPNLTVRIEGYTDASGADATNLAVSKARAEAVRQYLLGRGVDAARLNAEGFGEERPVADNASPAGRRQNRRVEVYLVTTAP